MPAFERSGPEIGIEVLHYHWGQIITTRIGSKPVPEREELDCFCDHGDPFIEPLGALLFFDRA
jgi:hypothetical protein